MVLDIVYCLNIVKIRKRNCNNSWQASRPRETQDLSRHAAVFNILSFCKTVPPSVWELLFAGLNEQKKVDAHEDSGLRCGGVRRIRTHGSYGHQPIPRPLRFEQFGI